MNDNCTCITVELPVSQFVKLEACATEHFRTPDAEASFLLSKWVEATRCAARRRRDVQGDGAAPLTPGGTAAKAARSDMGAKGSARSDTGAKGKGAAE